MLDFDVDVVLTYVDMADPVWQKNFEQTKAELKKAGKLPQFVNSYNADRFQSNNLIELALFSVREFMPWTRKVFLVVSNAEQVPQCAKDAGVEVVLHEQIIPKKHLPTFNSCTIELYLHRIPGLAERFIYVNDDMSLLHHVNKTLFFDVDGLPVNDFHFRQLNKQREKLGSLYPIYRNSFRIAMQAAGARFYRNRKTSLVPRHYPKPMLKSACEELWQKKEKELDESATPFRSEKSASNYMFCEYMLLAGHTHDQEMYTCQTLLPEDIFGSDTLTLNDEPGTNWGRLSIDELKSLLYPKASPEIDDLFRHSLVITCNKRRKILFNAMCRYAGLPRPSEFKAVTPEIMNGTDRNHNSALLDEMQKEYGFNAGRIWSGVKKFQTKKCCTLSHLLAAYYAKVNRWPYALVFEDDAWPAADVVGKLEEVLRMADELRSAGREIRFLRLGYNGEVDDGKGNCLGVVPYKKCAGSHAYVIYENCYDAYIRSALEKFKPADYLLTKDMQLKSWTTNKALFIQFNSRLYTDKNKLKNISSSVEADATYICNHIYGSETPPGYVDFRDVQAWMSDFGERLKWRLYLHTGHTT